MKKYIICFLFLIAINLAHSQDGVYLNMGKNFSSFSYKNRANDIVKMRINGVGDSYELGYSMPFKYKNFKELRYSGSATLNDYNAVGISNLNILDWKTTYFGIQNTVDYQFYEAYFFFLSAKAGLNMSTILRGKQVVNNSVTNLVRQNEFSGTRLVTELLTTCLVRQNEFSGLVFHPIIGVYAKYYLSKNGYLSVGYNLSKSFKLGNNTDNVSINNGQILFGGYFDLIKKVK